MELPGATPPDVRPPEVFMYNFSNGKVGSIWSMEADIWAVGCTVSYARLILRHLCTEWMRLGVFNHGVFSADIMGQF